MNFIPLEFTTSALVVAPILAGIGFIIVIALIVLGIVNKFDSQDIAIAIVLGTLPLLMTIAAVGSLLSGPEAFRGSKVAQLAEFQEEVRQSYGIDLDEKQVNDLKYPDREPRSDFKSYGDTQAVLSPEPGSYEKTELHLVSEGNELILVGTDGEELKPLSSRN